MVAANWSVLMVFAMAVPAAGGAEPGADPLGAAQGQAPERIAIPLQNPNCASGEGEIVVCGRKEDRYRIDPTVLAGLRAREAREVPSRPDRRIVTAEKCSPVGPNGCAFQNVLPVSAIALTLITAAVKAIKGEDLRPMLRAEPTDYELYEQAKADEERRKAAAGGVGLLELTRPIFSEGLRAERKDSGNVA